MAGLGSLYIDLLARTGKFETDIGRAARLAERRSNQIQQSFDGLSRKIGTALAAYASVQTVQAIVRISDQYTQLRGRLALVTEGTEELGRVQQSLFSIAQRTRTEMSGVSDLYIKLAQSGRELGASQQDLLRFTEGIGNALTVSGSSAQAASGALQQLSQALSGSKIQAEEFNSINDGAPEILRAVARNIDGLDGSIGKLRIAVKAGAVTSRDFFEAFLKDTDSLSKRAQSLPVTVGQAFTRMQNNINQAIGGVNMSPMIDAINQLSDVIADPKFQQGFASFVSGIIKITGKSAGLLAETANVARFVGEAVAARLSGAAADDIVRLEDELEKLQHLRSQGLLDADFLDRGRFFGKNGLVEWYSDADLDKAIAEIERQIKAFYDRSSARPLLQATVPSGSGSVTPAKPSEEFLKLSEKLKEQIALYGKVGKAAEISYQIQSGALDELSKSEQQQLLALAKRYDALVRSAEAEKQWQEAVTKGAQIAEEVRTPYETYKDALEELNDALQLGLVTLDTYTRALVKAQEEYVNTANAVSDFANQNSESLNQGLESFQADFEARFIKGLDTLTVFQEQAARNTQDIIADTLVSGFDQGLDGVMKSFGEMLKKLIAQAVAADLARRLFGAAGGGTGGGWIGMAAGALGYGGGRAIGGPVLAGTTYRINEREPEFFRPRVGGDIIPLSKMPNMRGGMALTQNFSVRTETGERVSRRTEQQLAAAASRGLAMASRRNN